MRGLSKISVIAAAFAGLSVSACSEKKEQPAAPVPVETPEPKIYTAPTAREVRDAFETVANSNAAPVKNPAGNSFYKVSGDIALRKDPDMHSEARTTVPAGACLQRIDGPDSHTHAMVDVVGQNAQGWVPKRALRPAPECAQ